MPEVFTYEFDHPHHKGKSSFSTGLFINGQFVDGVDKTYIELRRFLNFFFFLIGYIKAEPVI